MDTKALHELRETVELLQRMPQAVATKVRMKLNVDNVRARDPTARGPLVRELAPKAVHSVPQGGEEWTWVAPHTRGAPVGLVEGGGD